MKHKRLNTELENYSEYIVYGVTDESTTQPKWMTLFRGALSPLTQYAY